MPSISRRAYLRATGTAALGGSGVAVASAVASAADSEHKDTKPEYVTLSFDESLIEQYQPRLVLDGVENEPQAYHAVYVESAESELDVIVGFHRYLYQSGVDPGGADSHLGDHEPVYVYIDSQTGDPVKVQYSAYHWHENTVYWQDLKTDDSGKRPILQVVPRWHHHLSYKGWKEGTQKPVKNLLDSYPDWLGNGMKDDIHPGAVYNALEEMQNRDYWWRDGVQTSKERILASVYFKLGFHGASEADVDDVGW